MPIVKGKKFPYTTKGKKAARKYAKKKMTPRMTKQMKQMM